MRGKLTIAAATAALLVVRGAQLALADSLECDPGTSCLTAKELQDYCNSGKKTLTYGFCLGYIEGIVDGSNMFTAKICPHGKVTMGKMPDVFLAFMRTTDSTLWTKGPGRADLAVFAAFGEEFPCAEKPQGQ
jgi:hypothetical protein